MQVEKAEAEAAHALIGSMKSNADYDEIRESRLSELSPLDNGKLKPKETLDETA